MKNTNFPAGVRPTVIIVINQADGKTINIGNKDLVAGSLSLKTGTSNSGEFTVGGAVIGSFQFSLMNDTGKFDGINYVNAYVTVTMSAFVNGGAQTIQMGKFWFVNHKETGNVINCETYDIMQIFDEHQMYEQSVSYPTTACALARKIIKSRGISTIFGLDVSKDFDITEDMIDDDMTERECLSYIAQAMGKFVRYSGEQGGFIEFGWYDMSTVYDVGATFSHDLRTEPISITGAKVYPNGADESQDVGTSGYMVVISDNPLITEDNLEKISSNINNAVTGIAFYPGTFSIKANPAIEAGDVLKLQTDKQEITTIATTVTYKISLQESITADADDYAGDMRLSKKQRAKQYVDKKIAQGADKAISDQLKDPDSELSQAIAGGGGGGSGSLDFSKIVLPQPYIICPIRSSFWHASPYDIPGTDKNNIWINGEKQDGTFQLSALTILVEPGDGGGICIPVPYPFSYAGHNTDDSYYGISAYGGVQTVQVSATVNDSGVLSGVAQMGVYGRFEFDADDVGSGRLYYIPERCSLSPITLMGYVGNDFYYMDIRDTQSQIHGNIIEDKIYVCPASVLDR